MDNLEKIALLTEKIEELELTDEDIELSFNHSTKIKLIFKRYSKETSRLRVFYCTKIQE